MPGFVAAVALVVGALLGFRKWQLPVFCSLAFAPSAFATDRLFTNKTSVRSHQMYVAIKGHAPWGAVGPEWSGDSLPVVCTAASGTVIATMLSNQKSCVNGCPQRTDIRSKWNTTFLAGSEATTLGRLTDCSLTRGSELFETSSGLVAKFYGVRVLLQPASTIVVKSLFHNALTQTRLTQIRCSPR